MGVDYWMPNDRSLRLARSITMTVPADRPLCWIAVEDIGACAYEIVKQASSTCRSCLKCKHTIAFTNMANMATNR